MQEEQPNIETLEGCMFAGDLGIKKTKSKLIMIVGDTRVGKSTLFNYIVGVPLIGVETEDQDIELKPHYQSGADIKYDLRSVTLVPNIDTVVINKEHIGIADMAGFSDQARKYVGTYGVSYMLERVFSAAKQFKIMLVVSAPKFQMDQIGQIISPISNLVTLFRGETLLNPDNKVAFERLIESIAIVVAKSSKSQKFYLAKIERVIKFLIEEEKKMNATTQRKVILKILESIHQNARIDLFKKATSQQQLPKCKVLQKLSQPGKKWNYYNFEDKKCLKKQSIIELPFGKQYQAMLKKFPKQGPQYTKSGQAKKEKMKKTYRILSKFVQKATKSWYEQKIDYRQQFQALEAVIQNHPYRNIDLMMDQLNEQSFFNDCTERFVSRLDLIEQLQAIATLNDEVQSQYSGSLKVIDKILAMTPPLKKIFNVCRKIFCQNAEQERKFLIFTFINLRNLYQTEMQAKIDENSCADIPNIVSDSSKYILPSPIAELKTNFLKDFKPKKGQNKKYQEFLEIWAPICTTDNDAKIFHLLQTNTGLQIANNLVKKNKFKDALTKYLECNTQLQKYLSYYQSDDDKEQLEIYEFKQRQIFKKIGFCLEKLGRYVSALQLYEHAGFVHLWIECHKKHIESSRKKKDKYLAMEAYINTLKKFGKRSRAIQVYQQMIDEFECYPANLKKLKSQLVGLLQADSSQSSASYINQLQSGQIIENNQGLLKQIQQKHLMAEDYDYEEEEEKLKSNNQNEQEQSQQDGEIEPDSEDEAFNSRKQMEDNDEGFQANEY